MSKTTLSIRIPTDLKQIVVSAAKADERSITSFVVKALRSAVKDALRARAKLFRFGEPLLSAAPKTVRPRKVK